MRGCLTRSVRTTFPHPWFYLVRDMRLADDVALQWLERWDAGNRPPKGEKALRKVIASAHAYGRATYGSGRITISLARKQTPS